MIILMMKKKNQKINNIISFISFYFSVILSFAEKTVVLANAYIDKGNTTVFTADIKFFNIILFYHFYHLRRKRWYWQMLIKIKAIPPFLPQI